MKKTFIAAALVCLGSAYAADLTFNVNSAHTSQSTQVNGQQVNYRAYEGIVYVANPVDKDYQQLNIYIPTAYFKGGKINGFTAKSAPIFLPNQIGGYMPAKPGRPGLDKRAGNTPNAMLVALSKGYVVVSPGARGRTQKQGKAPAAIVDLKAAVRYLRFNDARMPGDAEKIISNGTSAGGALSVLLGASGNSADYEPYLKALGAADARTVRLMNPMHYIDLAQNSRYWRIRVGTNDRDTSLAIATILATEIANSGKQVDFAMPWGMPHSGDYDLDELFGWMQTISR